MALNVEFEHQSKRVRVTPGTTMVRVQPALLDPASQLLVAVSLAVAWAL